MTTIDRIAYSVKRKPGEPPLAELAPVPKAMRRYPAPALFETEVAGAQLVHQLENAPTAACHTRQWVIRDDDWQPGFFGEELVDVAQQAAATGQHDAALGHIGPKLGRS